MAEVESRHMRGLLRAAGVCPLVVGVAAILAGVGLSAQRAPADGEWRNYFGGTDGSKYSPLAQINKDNVSSLRIAWRWRTADRELQLSNSLYRAGRNEETPLMINGTLYTVTGLGLIAALDPASGTTRWVYDPVAYKAGVPNNGGFIQMALDLSPDSGVLDASALPRMTIRSSAAIEDFGVAIGGTSADHWGSHSTRHSSN